MGEGISPERFRSNISIIRLSERVEAEALYGERDPSPVFRQRIAQQMVVRWEADGRPKTIVRVPPMRGGSRDMVDQVLRAFHRAGARTLDTSGDDPQVKQQLLTALGEERELSSYRQSQYDVMVGVQRVNEGMDWKWCSVVYCVGLPRSTSFITQLMGRASRKKLPEWRYPTTHRELMQIEFFVPCGDDGTAANLPRYHGQSMLLTCAFLDRYEQNSDWEFIQALRRGITPPLGKSATEIDDIEAAVEPYVDSVHLGLAIQALDEAHENLVQLDREPSPGNLFNWVIEHRPDVPRTVLKYQLWHVIATSSQCSVSKAKRLLFEELNAHLQEGHSIREALITAFDAVLDSMMDQCTIQAQEIISPRLRRNLLELTGPQMQQFASQLALHRPLQPKWLVAVCRTYFGRYGRCPSNSNTQTVPGWPDERWCDIHDAIRRGERGWPLPQIQSLRRFFDAYVRPGGEGTIQQLVEAAARDRGLLAEDISRLLLDSFLDSKVHVTEADMEPVLVRDLPAVTPEGSTYSVAELLGRWLRNVKEVGTDPIIVAQAWALCRAVESWLADHPQHSRCIPGTHTEDCAPYTRRWRGTKLLFQVRASQEQLVKLQTYLYLTHMRGAEILVDQVFYCQIARCPFTATPEGDNSVFTMDMDEMLGSRLLSTQSIPVQLYVVGGRFLTTDDCPQPADFTRRLGGSLEDASQGEALTIRIPITWFTHILREGDEEAQPLDPAGTLRRMPDVLE
jgi:hypothetical protein